MFFIDPGVEYVTLLNSFVLKEAEYIVASPPNVMYLS